MKKKYFGVILVIIFWMGLPGVYAQDRTTITPVLSKDSISTSTPQINGPQPFDLAQNTVAAAQTDDWDEEDLFEDYDTQPSQTVADPLYYFNVAMYSFNDFLYFAALKPLANGYKAITPVLVRKGVRNFFHNLLFPVRLVNTLLQGRIKDAGTEVEVFFINSTIGVLGFGQVAQKEFNLFTSSEDLGQTLGTYAIGNGCYLVLPVLGPSTLRDAIGRVGDWFLTPVNYLDPWELSTGLNVYDTINATSFRIGDYEALKASAIDPYEAMKNAYIQLRNDKIDR